MREAAEEGARRRRRRSRKAIMVICRVEGDLSSCPFTADDQNGIGFRTTHFNNLRLRFLTRPFHVVTMEAQDGQVRIAIAGISTSRSSVWVRNLCPKGSLCGPEIICRTTPSHFLRPDTLQPRTSSAPTTPSSCPRPAAFSSLPSQREVPTGAQGRLQEDKGACAAKEWCREDLRSPTH